MDTSTSNSNTENPDEVLETTHNHYADFRTAQSNEYAELLTNFDTAIRTFSDDMPVLVAAQKSYPF